MIPFRPSSLLRVLIIALLFISSVNAMAQEGERPRVGLVLSGGGAKGLAHIGVIRVLEEAGIQPEVVTGTSMGSIIGALYATGYSGSELSVVNREADWNLLLTNDIPFNMIFLPEKYNYNRFAIDLPVSREGFEIPTGMIDGQELSALFSGLTFRTAGLPHFDSLPLPFRCIAADIVNARPLTFESGDLATAMRSSMAIPSVFTPVYLNDTTVLVDGGVYRNFPVQEAINLGADYIIGVYVGFPDKVNADDLNNLPGILARTTLLSGTKDIEQQSSLVDQLIVPDMSEFSTGSFGKGIEIEAAGEAAARSILPRLTELADSINRLGPPPEIKSLPGTDSVWISSISIPGLENTREEFILRKSGLHPGMWITPEIMEEAVRLAYGTLYYEKITYEFRQEQEGMQLVLNVRERPNTHVKASVHYDNYYGAGLVLGLSIHNLLIKSTKFNLVGDLSRYPQFRANYNIHMGARHNIYLRFYATGDYSTLPVFEEGVRTGMADDNALNAGASLNYILKTNNRIGIGAEYRRTNIKPEDALKLVYPILQFDRIGFYANNLSLQFDHNSLNSNLYPLQGTHAFLDFKYIYTGEEYLIHEKTDSSGLGDAHLDAEPFWKFAGGIQNYLTLAKSLSLNTGLNFGLSADETMITDLYYIGGFRYNLRRRHIPFVGLSVDNEQVYNFVKVNMGLQAEPVSGLYIGVLANYMMHVPHPDDFFHQTSILSGQNSLLGGGGGITYKSPLGPLSVWFGSLMTEWTPTWYVNLGYTF